MDFLINFFRLTRPLSNIKNIALVLLAFYFSGKSFILTDVIIGIVSLSFISSAVYAYNAANDVDIDKCNKNKEHYYKGVHYFGGKNSLTIIFLLVVVGLITSFFINIYFLITSIFFLLIGFLYSSKYTRFKEKVILDVLFGATFTFLFRFVASWFIFLISFPPLLPTIALVSAKTGGYLLYKQIDRPFLMSLNIRNSITVFKRKTLIIASVFFWIITFLSFFILCLNSRYFNIEFLGVLPINFLILILFVIPPLSVIYFYVFDKIKTKMSYLRTIGFCYWILVITIIWNLFL